jgi:hypothetical protein
MGAGALAGLISTETQPPTSDAKLSVAMGMENYSGRRLEVVANAPLSDALSARLAHQRFASDGWIENTYLGVDDTNNRDEQTTRFALRHVSGQHSVDMKVNKVEVKNGYDAFSLDNTRETLSDQPGEDSLDMTSALIRWNRFGEDYTSMIQVSDVSGGHSLQLRRGLELCGHPPLLGIQLF